jgi:ankyrin repeat protein
MHRDSYRHRSCRDVHANLKDERGRTPLSYAAQGRNVEIVQLLLARDGVDVNLNLKDRGGGHTALFHAVESEAEEMRLSGRQLVVKVAGR